MSNVSDPKESLFSRPKWTRYRLAARLLFTDEEREEEEVALKRRLRSFHRVWQTQTGWSERRYCQTSLLESEGSGLIVLLSRGASFPFPTGQWPGEGGRGAQKKGGRVVSRSSLRNDRPVVSATTSE